MGPPGLSRDKPVVVGMAFSRAAVGLVDELSDILDYVEYPYELLTSKPDAVQRACQGTAILHSASLSLASGDLPTADLLRSVADIADRISSPWVGEHLAFIAARPPDGDPGERFEIGYAVSPPMTAEIVDIVSEGLLAASSVVDRPLILENSPIYVPMPGSNMSQAEVVSEICLQSGAGVLLDLAHLRITCDTLALDPKSTLLEFPLGRIVEVHLSGVSRVEGRLWDDHSGTPDVVQYELLEIILDKAPVRAITHEYNWAPGFPSDVARREIDRTLGLLQAAR
jgi:uncharacterized protein (UPF0276 family)